MNKFIEKGYNVITCAPDEDKDTIIKLYNLGISYRKYFLSRQGLKELDGQLPSKPAYRNSTKCTTFDKTKCA